MLRFSSYAIRSQRVRDRRRHRTRHSNPCPARRAPAPNRRDTWPAVAEPDGSGMAGACSRVSPSWNGETIEEVVMSQSLPQEIGVLPEPARRGLAARRPSAAEGLLRSILILLVAYVVLVAGFMGWIARSAATDEAPSPPAASAAAASTQSRSIDVTLGDMFIKPSSVSVPAGTPLVFHVTNTGAITHNFTLGTGGATPDIAPGGSAELKAGPFSSSLQAYCSIPGHKQAGMVMTINVTSAASSPTAGPSPSARDATIDTSAT